MLGFAVGVLHTTQVCCSNKEAVRYESYRSQIPSSEFLRSSCLQKVWQGWGTALKLGIFLLLKIPLMFSYFPTLILCLG